METDGLPAGGRTLSAPACNASITAVVTTHDAKATLDACLDSLKAAGTCARVLVIDSGSADGCVDGLEIRHPGVEVVRLGRNRGPCATRNEGLALAETSRVLFLDDDMVLEPGLLAALADALDAHPYAAAAGPAIVTIDRPGQIQYAGGKAHFGGLPHLLRHGEPPDRGQPPERVDILTAGCVLVDRARVLEVGGFDEAFFYLAEDVDLSLRLRQCGYELVVVPSAVVRNAGGSTALSLRDDAYPARRIELHSRNRLLLIAKNYDRWTLFVLLPALLLYEAAWFVFAAGAGHMVPWLKGKRRAVGVIAHHALARRPRKKIVPDRLLLGAPPMSFTESALAQPMARLCATAFDGTLRMLWTVLRGGLQ